MISIGSTHPSNMADNIVSMTAACINGAVGSTRLTLASSLAEVRSDEAAELARELTFAR